MVNDCDSRDREGVITLRDPGAANARVRELGRRRMRVNGMDNGGSRGMGC